MSPLSPLLYAPGRHRVSIMPCRNSKRLSAVESLAMNITINSQKWTSYQYINSNVGVSDYNWTYAVKIAVENDQ